jgi:hypothetical protein
LINVDWQLREVSGRFHRLRPKDDSYRSTNAEPLTPVDIPPFLAGLLAAQAGKHARQRCTCAAGHGRSGRYLFLGPDGGHHRNSNYARRIFRPACDGRHPPANGTPGRLVIADATAWPGTPAASWPPAVPGKPFAPPSGRGTQRLTSTGDTGRCPSCGHAVRLRLDGRTVAHKNVPGHCPGSGKQPADDAPLACWLPVKDALTPHGHKTWMAEDGIPEILAEQRLGHQVPGNARPVRPRLAADARETDRGSAGPVGGVPPAARRHPPALPGPVARQLAGAVPGRASRSPRSGATIGVLKGQRRVLRSQFPRLDYLADCVLRSHTWRFLLRMPVPRDSDGAAHRDPALRRPLRISAPVRLH